MTAIAFQNAALLRRLADPSNPPESIAALARDLQRDKSNTRRAMTSLEDEGLIEGLALTAKGRQVLAGIDVAEGVQPAPAADAAAAPPTWPLDRIVRNPANRDVDPASIPAMADSLVAQGQLQPITLTPVREDGTRMLLIGERRWLGAKLAAEQGRLPDSLKAGLRFEEREATPAEAIAITVVENVERQEIPPLELAFLLRDYADAAGEEGKPLDAKSVAERLGLGVRDVQDKIRIARQATPEAIAAYREHGSWDRLRDSVTEKKAAKSGPADPYSFDSLPPKARLVLLEIADKIARQPYVSPEDDAYRPRHATVCGESSPDPTGEARLLVFHQGLGFLYQRGRPNLVTLGSRTWDQLVETGDLTSVGAVVERLHDLRTEVIGSDEADRLAKADEYWTPWLNVAADEAADDPLVVNGVRHPNLTRANEARRAAGILPRQANHGGGAHNPPIARIDPSLTQDEIDVAYAAVNARADAARDPRGSMIPSLAVLTTDPAQARARLALIEIAHKIGTQRRPLDPVNPAEWTGDVDQDFLTHGCTCGAHWLDPQVQTLIQLGAARVVQIPGGCPPMLALTAAGLQYLQSYGCALPITGAGLSVDQQIAGAPATPPGGAVAYVTACLAKEAAAPPEADPSVPDNDPTAAVALNDDPWDRTPEQIAEAEALLSRVLAFTCEDAETLPTEGDTAAGLLDLLGLRPAATITDQGGIRLETGDGQQVELITVDAAGHHPDEYAKALAAMVAWAFERAIGGEG